MSHAQPIFAGSFYGRLLEHPAYPRLCGFLAGCPDGNLLERTDPEVRRAQAEFLRWALWEARPQVLAETGTNKGFFGLLVAAFLQEADLPPAELHTFDRLPECGDAVAALNQSQAQLRCVFHLGDSREAFAAFREPVQFAWIDGGQEADVVLADLLNCYRLRVPWVAVDDTAYRVVWSAVRYVLDATEYVLTPHPWWETERRRRAALLRLAPLDPRATGAAILQSVTDPSEGADDGESQAAKEPGGIDAPLPAGD